MIMQSKSCSNSRRTHILWKEYFQVPMLWCDNRSTKIISTSPDFMHATSCEHLWLNGRDNPCWVHDELRSRKIMLSKQKKVIDRQDNLKTVYHKECSAFVTLLKSCTGMKDFYKGSNVHTQILKRGLLEKEAYLGSALINFYAKCEMLAKSEEVFEMLQVRDAVTWNTLIGGYANQGQALEAMSCFERMQIEGLSPDAVTYISMLKVCGSKQMLNIGQQIHDKIVNRGLLEKDTVLGTALINMYGKCGLLAKAQNVLEQLPMRNEVSWNVLIGGYSQKGQVHAAMRCLEQMQNEGINPNQVTYVCILSACGKTRTLEKGIHIHTKILNRGLLESHIVLGTTLVDMYAKCSALVNAQEVHDNLPYRNAVSWNALITGYADHGQNYEVLNCFEQMQNEGLHCNTVTFISVLKACGSMADLSYGESVHNEIVKNELLYKDIALGAALVDMYAKCGALGKAKVVFDELPTRNVVVWSSLIMGYVLHGEAHEALNCYRKMQNEGLSPDTVTFICVLKACGITRALDIGNSIHCEMVRMDLLQRDVMLGTALVDMYGKCNLLEKAEDVLDDLPIRNVATWNALIAGYAQYGQGEDALNCFTRMRNQGLFPDSVTLICLLNACGKTGSLAKGKEIHDEIVRRGLLEKEVVLANALIDMYSKCGLPEKAQKVLEELPVQNVVSWSAVIAGYAHEGLHQKALKCFSQMQSKGLFPDVITLVCILKVCGSMRAIEKGEQIHEEIRRKGLLQDVMLGTALMDMYVKCDLVLKAKKVLEELSDRDVISWNVLIAGYVECGQRHMAMNCFETMQNEGLSPDSITFIYLLKACGSTDSIKEGIKIHEEIIKRGFVNKDIVLGAALVDMYVKCRAVVKAQQIFQELSLRDATTWNALIGGYANQGQCSEVMNCFENMQSEGFAPDGVTFSHVLKACSSMHTMDWVRGIIRDEILKRGLLNKDIALGTALVYIYAKHDMLMEAKELHTNLPNQGVISWNALITGYVKQRRAFEALNCLEQMQTEGLLPNVVTFICILKACGSIGAIEKGKHVHKEIVNAGFLCDHIELGNALVDMYVKCGVLTKAQQVLDELPIRGVVSWNSVIAGYAEKGFLHEAFSCFQQMRIEGLCPDEVTILCLINACSHSGLLDKAETLFGYLNTENGISPKLEHNTSMVMVYGCTGHFGKAISMIMGMPSPDGPAIWLALLAACKKWGNVKLGKLAFDQAVQLDKSNAAAFILMASTFSAAGMEKDAEALVLKHAS